MYTAIIIPHHQKINQGSLLYKTSNSSISNGIFLFPCLNGIYLSFGSFGDKYNMHLPTIVMIRRSLTVYFQIKFQGQRKVWPLIIPLKGD